MENSTIQASILVVSRTPDLLSRLLQSLDLGYSGEAEAIEVLASWNGSAEGEKAIEPGRLPFRIAQRDPYHFAENMNGLARRARGSVLIFANDDLIVDPGSIDAALDRLANRAEVGLVGARLRTSDGALAHAGIHFTSYGSPYHQLEHFAEADHPAAARERLVPAVTGAFFAMRREEFLQLELAESFNVCGEDVLLNLQTRSVLHKQVLYCPAMSGIHDAESTRSQFEEQQGNADDMTRMRAGWREMLQRADRDNLLVELQAAQDEAEDLRGIYIALKTSTADTQIQIKNLLASVEQQTNVTTELESQLIQQQASQTHQQLQQSLLESENKRLRSRVQQLENQLLRISHQAV
jgi:GT2 family glycosyltransferase